MTPQLQSKIAIVTGAAQGLGAALCERLRAEGASVVPADIKGFDVAVDVTKEADVAALFDRAVKDHGRVDIVVANAAILIAEPIAEADAEKWRAVMNVNLFGNFLTMKHACRVMMPNKRGAIIQINSKSGKKGSAANSAYAASKFGGIGLVQSVALEMAPHGIRCNAICPGTVDTPSLHGRIEAQPDPAKAERDFIARQPMGRFGRPEEVAELAVYLASDAAAFMTGQAVVIDGGMHL